MPKYFFFYNRSGGSFNKHGDRLQVPISALTKYAEVDAENDLDFLTKISGISGLAWKTIGTVLSDELISRAPYYSDIVLKAGQYYVIDTNWALAPVEIDKNHIDDETIVDRQSPFASTPGGLIPLPENMNRTVAEQGKKVLRQDTAAKAK